MLELYSVFVPKGYNTLCVCVCVCVCVCSALFTELTTARTLCVVAARRVRCPDQTSDQAKAVIKPSQIGLLFSWEGSVAKEHDSGTTWHM